MNGDARTDPGATKVSWTEELRKREDPKWDSFSWLTVRALFGSINDLFAKSRPEIVEERRARWIAQQRGRGPDGISSLVVDRSLPPAGADPTARSFLLLGDTGEQDASQYAVAPYLSKGSTQADPKQNPLPPEFLVIASDVIYPAGDINEYVNGFYIPYRNFKKPIYALPGNHDWYDGLDGFMYHFCGAEPLSQERFRTTEVRPGERIASQLWRGSAIPERMRLGKWRDSRPWGRDATKAVQPGPYFAIDLGDLLLVCIDTGVTGTIDDEQGRWLLRTSEIEKQKILLTGKPIYVDGEYHPGEISWRLTKEEKEDQAKAPPFRTVDDVVRHERFGYLAAIGGDVHNYQRYPIRLKNQKRTMLYLVSGGGGAYLSPTHRIPPIETEFRAPDHPWPRDECDLPKDEDLLDPEEAAAEERADLFRCYPKRGDSLAYTAQRAAPRMSNAVQTAAAAFVAAAAMLLYAAPLQAPGWWALVTVYAPIAGSVAALIAYKKWRKRYGKAPDRDDPESKGWARYRTAAVAFFVLLVVAVVALAVSKLDGGEALSSPRFWAMTGIAALIPPLLVGAIVWAHDLRGSTPAALPQLVTLAALAAAVAIFARPGELFGAPAWFATVLLVLAIMALGTLTVGAVKNLAHVVTHQENEPATPRPRAIACNLLDRLLTVLGPALLAVALSLHTEAGFAPCVAPALAFAGLWPTFWAQVLGTGEPTDLVGVNRRLNQIEGMVSFLAIVAWLTVAAILLHGIGDGWVIAAAVGSVAVVTIALSGGLLIAFARVRNRFRLATGIGVVVLGVPWLAPAGGASPLLPASAAALALLVTALLSVRALRTGELNANVAQDEMRRLLNDGKKIRPGPRAPVGDPQQAQGILKLLYPFQWQKTMRRKGSRPLPETIARLIAELGNSDKPPFFKNLLRVDIRELDETAGGDGGCPLNRELTIRCFGVTGFAADEEDPPLEDEFHIPFRSRSSFELWRRDGDSPQRAAASEPEPTH